MPWPAGRSATRFTPGAVAPDDRSSVSRRRRLNRPISWHPAAHSSLLRRMAIRSATCLLRLISCTAPPTQKPSCFTGSVASELPSRQPARLRPTRMASATVTKAQRQRMSRHLQIVRIRLQLVLRASGLLSQNCKTSPASFRDELAGIAVNLPRVLAYHDRGAAKSLCPVQRSLQHLGR